MITKGLSPLEFSEFSHCKNYIPIHPSYSAQDPSIDSDSGAKGFYYFVRGLKAATENLITVEAVLDAGRVQDIIPDIKSVGASEIYDGSEKHQ